MWQHALRIAGESAIAGGVRRPDLTTIEPPLFDWRHVIAEAQVRLALQHACGAPELVGVAQPLLVSTTDVIAALDCGVSAIPALATSVLAAPDLAVLIAAPDASLTHQHRRVQRALLAGVREVLSIDPFVRVGVRFDAAGAPTPHVRGQLPSLVCPGLTIDLDALWQRLDDPRRRWTAPTPAIIPSEPPLPYVVHTGAASSSIPQLTPEHTVPVTLTPQPMTGAMLADLPPRAHYGWSGERLLVEDWATTRRLMRLLLRAHGLHQTVALLPRERWLLALGRREPSQRDRRATRHA